MYVVIPPPIHGDYPVKFFEMSAEVINQHLPTQIAALAAENEVPVIDAFKAMGGTHTYTYT